MNDEQQRDRDLDWLDRADEFDSTSFRSEPEYSGSSSPGDEFVAAARAERRGMMLTIFGVLIAAGVAAGYFFYAGPPFGGSSSSQAGTMGGNQPVNVPFESSDSRLATNTTRNASVGSKAPDFEFRTIEGMEGKLSNYQGEKKVLVNLWATWCGPCKTEIKHLQAFSERHGDKAVVLAVEVDARSESKIKQFAEDHNMQFPVMLDTDNDVTGTYRARGIPTTYLVDTDGTVTDKQTGAFTSVSGLERFAGIN